jgi:hypothetical protein
MGDINMEEGNLLFRSQEEKIVIDTLNNIKKLNFFREESSNRIIVFIKIEDKGKLKIFIDFKENNITIQSDSNCFIKRGGKSENAKKDFTSVLMKIQKINRQEFKKKFLEFCSIVNDL